MSKPEDISVILGRIREKAEQIIERRVVSDRDGENHLDGIRILELIEQAQKVVLEAQLEASLKAVSK